MHGQPGAPAGFAGDGNNLYGAIGDFQRTSSVNSFTTNSGAERESTISGPRPVFFHGFDKTAELFAGLVFLNRHTFATGQGRLVAAEVYHHIAALEAADHAADDIAHAILEFIIDQRLPRSPGVVRF